MKKILVTKSSMPPYEEYIEAIKPLWGSHWLTNMGTMHNILEDELKSYLGVDGISLFCNGHMALELAIQALNLTGEVITTPYTFASTTHAIVRNRLIPVFCDIDPQNYTIDVKKIESLITDKTSAIIPVHVYGNVCDVYEIEKIAKRYGLKVLYDAAHAFGVTYDGIGIGNFGNASMFSFHATKVYNTIEGGAVTFSDKELEVNLYRLKNFGIRGEEKIDYVGANAKMNEFQATMGICNLKYVDQEIKKRRTVFERYMENLADIAGIHLPVNQRGVKKNYAYFPVIFDEKVYGISRDEVYDDLKKNNIYTRKYFYPLANEFDCYHEKYETNKTPIAKYISDRVLVLPLYADLELKDVDRICMQLRLYQSR